MKKWGIEERYFKPVNQFLTVFNIAAHFLQY